MVLGWYFRRLDRQDEHNIKINSTHNATNYVD